jgi:hypothetical protein
MSACRKFVYADKRAAQSQANARTTGRHRIRRHRTNRLRIYYCAACNGWHLTSQEKEL